MNCQVKSMATFLHDIAQVLAKGKQSIVASVPLGRGPIDSKPVTNFLSTTRAVVQARQAGMLDSEKEFEALQAAARTIDILMLIIQNQSSALEPDEKLAPKRVWLDANEILLSVVAIFDAAASAKEVDLKLVTDPSARVFCDPALMFRCITNLVDNAVKYSFSTAGKSSRRFVEIRARRHSQMEDFYLEVSSFGIGVDADEVASGICFEYGYRGKYSSDRDRVGSGIGLAEAKRIVDAHGGSIGLESRPEGDAFLTIVSVVVPGETRRDLVA